MSGTALVKVTRDKRGYEHFYLVQASGRRGRSSQRILYWFRTPPGVKVGRTAFDAEARRAIEAGNPGVTFDWDRLLDVRLPPPDLEKWRERRRERVAGRRARRDEILEEDFDEQVNRTATNEEGPTPDEARAAETARPVPEATSGREPVGEPPGEEMPAADGARRRRRRRGGRRNRRGPTAPPADSAAADAADVETAGFGAEHRASDDEPDVEQ